MQLRNLSENASYGPAGAGKSEQTLILLTFGLIAAIYGLIFCCICTFHASDKTAEHTSGTSEKILRCSYDQMAKKLIVDFVPVTYPTLEDHLKASLGKAIIGISERLISGQHSKKI